MSKVCMGPGFPPCSKSRFIILNHSAWPGCRADSCLSLLRSVHLMLLWHSLAGCTEDLQPLKQLLFSLRNFLSRHFFNLWGFLSGHLLSGSFLCLWSSSWQLLFCWWKPPPFVFSKRFFYFNHVGLTNRVETWIIPNLCLMKATKRKMGEMVHNVIYLQVDLRESHLTCIPYVNFCAIAFTPLGVSR